MKSRKNRDIAEGDAAGADPSRRLKSGPVHDGAGTAVRPLGPATPVRYHRSNSNAPLALVGGTRRGGPADRDLVVGLVAGEAWAMAETWNRFAPMVLMTARRSLGSRAEAEDIAQEVFLGVFRKAQGLRDPDSLRSFIYSFAVRVLKAELRRRKVRGWLPFMPEAPVDFGFRTLDVEARDLLRKLYALLDRLSPRDRLAFVLRRMEAMTVEEIAATMDISISTVKRSIAHASSRLSRWIAADPGLAGLQKPRGDK
jgi:RNA polymerase sigma-70 factor (ECF subfamily)